jgi:hypothetical protein
VVDGGSGGVGRCRVTVAREEGVADGTDEAGHGRKAVGSILYPGVSFELGQDSGCTMSSRMINLFI